jgi:molecular chaperone GrpE (heat shock protein)
LFEETQRQLNEALEEVRSAMEAGAGRPATVSTSASLEPARRRPEAADRLYAQMLGLVLSAGIKELDNGHFEAVVARAQDNLNRIFREQSPPAADLQKLQEHASELSQAVEEVVQVASQLNAEVATDLQLVIDRINRYTEELRTLQTNVTQRRLDLNLQIRAFTGPRAQSAFLEELGLALKQAIDKFADPQTYFERNLEKLITEDVVWLVATCDTHISPPDQHAELEGRLREAFFVADLEPIQPSRHEPFQPTEHNVVQLVPGGRSQTIAKAVRRGFYYRRALLSKADVVVYS